MKFLQLLEHNVYNLDELDSYIRQYSGQITNAEVGKKFYQLVRKYLVNELKFLSNLTEIPSNAPEWAKQSKDLYLFKSNLELDNELEHMVHWIIAMINISTEQLNNTDPNYTISRQLQLESIKTLQNLQKITYEEAVKKSNEYFIALSKIKYTVDSSGYEEILNVNGWIWYELKSETAFKQEGRTLQNCIGQVYHYDPKINRQIVVLKDPQGESHIAIHVRDNSILEIKGKQNKPPVSKYIIYVQELFNKLELVNNLASTGKNDLLAMGFLIDNSKIISKQEYYDKYGVTENINGFLVISVQMNDSNFVQIKLESEIINFSINKTNLDNIKKDLSQSIGTYNGEELFLFSRNDSTMYIVSRYKKYAELYSRILSHTYNYGFKYIEIFLANLVNVDLIEFLYSKNIIPSYNWGNNSIYDLGYYLIKGKLIPIETYETQLSKSETINGVTLTKKFKKGNYITDVIINNKIIFQSDMNLEPHTKYILPKLNIGNFEIIRQNKKFINKYDLLKFSVKYNGNEILSTSRSFEELMILCNVLDSVPAQALNYKNTHIYFYKIKMNYAIYGLIVSNDINYNTVITFTNKDKILSVTNINHDIYDIIINTFKFNFDNNLNNSTFTKLAEIGKFLKDGREVDRTEFYLKLSSVQDFTICKMTENWSDSRYFEYFMKIPNSEEIKKGFFILDSQNNTVGSFTISASNHINKIYISQDLDEDSKQTIMKIIKTFSDNKKLKSPKTINPNQSFHKMLQYINDNPGKSRSAYYKEGLGRKPAGQPGFTSIDSMDKEAQDLGLITVKIINNRYFLTITDKGKEALEKLNSGEKLDKLDI